MMRLESKTWTGHSFEGMDYYTIPSFDRTGLVVHLFPTKLGGFSQEPYGMNLGISGEDDPAAVRANYEKIARILGISPEDFFVSAQQHHTNILRVEEADRGYGVVRPRQISDVDGLVTNVPHVALVTIHADCVPLYFLDPVHRAIGLAHAGWRGTAAKIGKDMVARMQQEFHTDPKDLLCGIGPSIGPECFEVHKDVTEAFQQAFGPAASEMIYPMTEITEEEKFRVDLWKANQWTLQEEGVLPEHITVTDLCTASHPEIFHSYRTSRTPGRMGAVLCLI